MKDLILVAVFVLVALAIMMWLGRSWGSSEHSGLLPLAARLSTGGTGIKWTVPGSWEMGTSNAALALYTDPETDRLWAVTITPYGLDVSEEHFGLLGREIEQQARRQFESDTPRTREEGRSPLVSVEAVTVHGVRAVEAVYRQTYEPGNEIVVGRLMIPLAEGSAFITVMAKAALTGLRESVLMVRALEEQGSETKDWPTLTQGQIDDPAFDDRGLSPLGSVREALRWLTSEDGAGLSVTQPAGVTSPEVSLSGPGCSIVPPPRYVRVSRDFPRADTMGVLSRVALEPDEARLLDVYRVPDQRLQPGDSGALADFARANAQGWASEGAEDISSDLQEIDMNDGRAHVGNHIQYSVNGARLRAFAHWFLDVDGVLYRVAVCGAPHTPVEELATDARRTVETLRRDDAPP